MENVIVIQDDHVIAILLVRIVCVIEKSPKREYSTNISRHYFVM